MKHLKENVKALNKILGKEKALKYVGVSTKDLGKAFKKAIVKLNKDGKAEKLSESIVKFYNDNFSDEAKATAKADKKAKKEAEKAAKKAASKKSKGKGVVRIAVEAFIKNPNTTGAEVNAVVVKKLGKEAKSTVSNVMCVMGHVKEVMGLGEEAED